MRRRLILPLLFGLLTSPWSAAEERTPILPDLGGTDDLARRFDAAAGHVRLVLLLSPT